MPKRLCLAPCLVLLLAALLRPGMATAGSVFIRLVEGRSGTPVEFFEKSVLQPELGNTLHWRMPQTVFVDGTAQRFPRYGGGDGTSLIQDDAKPEGMAGVADMEKELGTDAGEDGHIRSDMASQVLGGTGPKALVTAEVADGEHTVLPGAATFTVANGSVTKVAGTLVKKAESELRLPCRPVDISFPKSAGPAVQAMVTQAGKSVFQEILNGQGAQTLRLLLPESAQDYAIQSAECGDCTFRVGATGVTLTGTPRPKPNYSVAAQGFVLAFAGPAIPPPAASPARVVTKPELYLFMDRNRSVYAEGERLQVSVRAWGLAATGDRVTLTLTNTTGNGLALAPQPLTATGLTSAAAELELDSGCLRPGDYTVHAQWGTSLSNPLPLKLVSLLPATNMKLFGYNKWGSASYDPKDLAAAVRNGLNLVVQGGTHNQGASTMGASPFSDWEVQEKDRPVDANRFKDFQRPAFPPELLDLPLEHDAGAEYLLAHGIENMPTACPLILYFNVGAYWRHHADDRNQGVAQLGQEWRRFPNFTGIVHTTGDGPTPATMGMVWAAGPSSFDIVHEERMKKLREVFEFKVGKLKLDDSAVKAEFEKINGAMQGAIGFGVGMNTGAKVEGDDAVKVEWAKWVNDLYPNAFREERQALVAMLGKPVVNCSATWGPGIGGGMWYETFYRALNNPVIDLHGDYGIMPLTYSSGSDLLCAGLTTRPWESLDLLPERPFANGLKIFLEALSRNPAGIGALNCRGEVAGGWGDKKTTSEGMSVLMDIGRRFGDLFMTLERRDEIAILVSFRQAALDQQSNGRLYGAHFLASKAGYQPVHISEDDVLRDPARLNRHRAVFLVNMTRPLPAALTSALTAFRQQGGVLIADETTKADLPDLMRVKLSELNGANEVNFRNVYAAFEPLVKAFRDTLGPRLKPFFSSSAADVHLVRSLDGDLEYWTLFNDTLPGPDASGSGHFVQFLYKGVKTDLAADRGGALYDALRRERVAAQGDKRLEWHADLRLLPGTVYLCADRPIVSLEVSAPQDVARGETLCFSARALDAAGKPFTGRLPLGITLTAPDGSVRYNLFRTTNLEVMLKLAGNDPAGTWTWTLTDQATGLAAKGEVTVGGAETAPAVAALPDLVYDAPAIHEALRQRELDVLIFPEQLALRDTAAGLVEKLQAAGVKASLRVAWPALLRQYPMNWKEWTVDDEEIHLAVLAGDSIGHRVRGKNQHGTSKKDDKGQMAFYGHYTSSAPYVYYRDVILLGCGDVPSNPMLDLITRQCRMLPRNPSPSFPAPGFGLVAYAWAPFHYGHDATVVYGRDAKGLERAAAALVAMATAKSAPAAPRQPRYGANGAEHGQLYAGLGLKPGATTPVTLRSTERIGESLLPGQFDIQVLDARFTADGKLLVKTEHQTELKAPPFAVVDLATGTAKRLNSEDKAVRQSPLACVAPGAIAWSAPLVRRLADGSLLLPVDRGLARLDAKSARLWYYDPFPISQTFEEARYPRRCQQLVLTPDEKYVAAVFYDLNSGHNYGPTYRMFNQGATVVLEVATGKEVTRHATWLAGLGGLALAADGSRLLVADTVLHDEHGRAQWNPTGAFAIAAFDRAGKQLCCFPGAAVESVTASRDGSLAVIRYGDARKSMALLSPVQNRLLALDYPRIDIGAAVAAGGEFAVICYADAMARKVAPDGRILWAKRLPAPGVPAVAADNSIVVCANDGNVYFPESDRQPLPFGNAPTETLTAHVLTPPPGIHAPAPPPAQPLGENVKLEALPDPAVPATLASFTGEQKLTLNLPALGTADVALLTFEYRLQEPATQLRVTFAPEPGKPLVSYLFPCLAQPQTVSVPLRPRQAGPLTLALAVDGGNGAVAKVKLQKLDLEAFANSARAGTGVKSGNPNSPRLFIPNVQGALGDPRVEQVAFAFPDGKFALPPDLQGQERPKSDVFSVFDADVHSGTPLYPTVYPGRHPWDPPQSIATMRCAQVVLEFAKPVAVEALGVWEHPGDLPVREAVLEYAMKGPAGGLERDGDWKLAFEHRNNLDYYHFHRFAEPVTAKLWRYTIIDTPSVVQRLAEIELYQTAVDAMENDLPSDDAKPSKRGGGKAAPDEPEGL